MRRLIHILITALALIVVSCTHKELCYDHSHVVEVNISFVWEKAPMATPASMSLYLFPEKGGRPLRFEFTNYNGGRIRLSRGRYHAICLNSDTRNIMIDDVNDFESFCITTRDATAMSGLTSFGIMANEIPKAKDSENERVTLSPEMTWSHSLRDIDILEQDQTITFVPERRTVNYTVEIKNVQNLKWVNGLSGTISSMSGGFHPGRHCLSEEYVTIPFEARMHREESMITGAFSSFGHCPSVQQTHHLIIYGILADNSRWYYDFDVTDQVHNSQDPYEIHIVLEDLPFPKPVVNGGGFQPEVDEWNSVDIVIPM
jgi:hypothetical protein